MTLSFFQKNTNIIQEQKFTLAPEKLLEKFKKLALDINISIENIDVLYTQIPFAQKKNGDLLHFNSSYIRLINKSDLEKTLNTTLAYIIKNIKSIQLAISNNQKLDTKLILSQLRITKNSTSMPRTVNFCLDHKTGDLLLLLETKSKTALFQNDIDSKETETNLQQQYKKYNREKMSGTFKTGNIALSIQGINIIEYASLRTTINQTKLEEKQQVAMEVSSPFVISELTGPTIVKKDNRQYQVIASLKATMDLIDYFNEYLFIKLELHNQIRIIAEIAQGLTAIHTAGYVHLDIKPENILIKIDNQGIPHALVADLDFICKEGTIKLCGTNGFIAPELLNNMHLLSILSYIELKNSQTNNLLTMQQLQDILKIIICSYILHKSNVTDVIIPNLDEDIEIQIKKSHASLHFLNILQTTCCELLKHCNKNFTVKDLIQVILQFPQQNQNQQHTFEIQKILKNIFNPRLESLNISPANQKHDSFSFGKLISSLLHYNLNSHDAIMLKIIKDLTNENPEDRITCTQVAKILQPYITSQDKLIIEQILKLTFNDANKLQEKIIASQINNKYHP